MAKISSLLLFSLVAILSCFSVILVAADNISRSDFPEGFIFGVGSAAYQYEGAAYEDGKGKSIWDRFIELYPEKVTGESNGTVALDFYHKYKDDVQLLKNMSVDAFRFSISWPRVLPTGKVSGGVNELGIQFYNNLIDELIANGITPVATIFHWDLPNALQEEYSGFLSPLIVEDFKNYADLLFKTFGDRVQYWTTVNEPNLATRQGYNYGYFAPGRCSPYMGNCTTGNSASEPYVVVHHQLLCHAVTVDLYRKKYQATQGGIIGFSIATDWNLAIDHKPTSRAAANRANDFLTGWFLEPVVLGRYPKTMCDIVGDRLPVFTDEQIRLLKGSYDFVGLNYYTTNFIYDTGLRGNVNLSYTNDWGAGQTQINTQGEPIGQETVLSWLYIYPEGLTDLLSYVKQKYGDLPIMITENGMADANNASMSVEEALVDDLRIKYHTQHLTYLKKAIEDGSNVLGYFAWSFLDDFEWYSGYTIRFGFHYVDFDTLVRYPKKSVTWFKEFLQNTNTTTTTETKDEL
ncbi:Beta-glucosidase 17-like protein [Drosera capensis]